MLLCSGFVSQFAVSDYCCFQNFLERVGKGHAPGFLPLVCIYTQPNGLFSMGMCVLPSLGMRLACLHPTCISVRQLLPFLHTNVWKFDVFRKGVLLVSFILCFPLIFVTFTIFLSTINVLARLQHLLTS